MSLDEKIQAAVALIADLAARHSRPMVYSSFGKDSMVLLALVAKAGLKLPIVFHREAFEPKKYSFANRVIEQNGYEVYDWAPLGMQVSQRGSEFEIVNRHQVSPTHSDYLPIGIRESREGEASLCGLKDLYLKPTGSFVFPWDLVFNGHKSTDQDPILGALPLSYDSVDKGETGPYTLAFPLRHFTDEDVWTYTKREGLPINRGRYDEAQGWKERPDLSANPDWFAVCTACMRKDGDEEVLCPKQNRVIKNVSGLLDWFDPGVMPEYVKLAMEAGG